MSIIVAKPRSYMTGHDDPTIVRAREHLDRIGASGAIDPYRPDAIPLSRRPLDRVLIRSLRAALDTAIGEGFRIDGLTGQLTAAQADFESAKAEINSILDGHPDLGVSKSDEQVSTPDR